MEDNGLVSWRFRRRRRGVGGFNLLELALVVGAVVLIASLLFPRLRAARDRARRIRCVSHLKQMGLGFRIWASDHQERFPWQVSVGQGGIVPDTAVPGETFGEVVNAYRSISNELTVATVLVCPFDRERRPVRGFEPNAPDAFGGLWTQVRVDNLSYFAGWDAVTASAASEGLLTGDRHLAPLLAPGSGDGGRSGVVKRLPPLADRFPASPPLPERLPAADLPEGYHEGRVNLGLADGSAHQVGRRDWLRFSDNAVSSSTNGGFRLVFPRQDAPGR